MLEQDPTHTKNRYKTNEYVETVTQETNKKNNKITRKLYLSVLSEIDLLHVLSYL